MSWDLKEIYRKALRCKCLIKRQSVNNYPYYIRLEFCGTDKWHNNGWNFLYENE